MQPRRLVALAGLLLTLSVVSVRAQVLEPPPRPYRGLFGGGPPPDPTRSRQELNLTGSLLGGYEDSLVPPYGGSPVIAYPAGSTVFWDAGLNYRIGEQVHSFEAKGRGYMNGYSLDGVGPYYGGEQSIRARTKLGRRIELEVTEDFRFDPYLTLGLFNTIQGFDIAGTPDAHSTTAVTTSRSKIFNGSGVASYNWNRRTKTDFGVSYNKLDADGLALDRDAISPWVAYEHALNRTLSVVAAYRGSDSHFTTVSGFKTPMQDHRVDGGLKYRGGRPAGALNMSSSGRLALSAVDTPTSGLSPGTARFAGISPGPGALLATFAGPSRFSRASRRTPSRRTPPWGRWADS
ncbi:MAG: hypothetical protein DMF89_05135 [Acidobacteria bacterium]|nr:MAG: hypothetical protein DMF89_05135 [Acidobacteriota bacterium]